MIGIQQITRVVMHHNPDADEALGYDYLRRYSRHLAGISEAPIDFSRSNEYKNGDGKSIEELEEDGVLFIGRHTELFNEHTTLTKARDDGCCTASIIAQALGVDELPQEQELLSHVILADTKGDPHPMCLSRGMKHLNNAGMDSRKVLDWALLAFDAVRFGNGEVNIDDNHLRKVANRLRSEVKVRDQSLLPHKWNAIKRIVGQYSSSTFRVGIAAMFQTLYKKEMYRRAAEKWLLDVLRAAVENQIRFLATINTFKREQLLRTLEVTADGLYPLTYSVVVVESDEYMALQAARYLSDKPAVTIIRKSSGQTSIFGRKSYGQDDCGIMLRHNFDTLARIIRTMEIARKGLLGDSFKNTDAAYMAREGLVENAPEWFYFPPTMSLFNGSRTAPDVPATNLPLEDIVKVVCLILRQQRLPQFWS